MSGRMLDWRHDASMFDDWLDEVYLIIETRSKGRYQSADLDTLPIIRVMTMCEMMIDADRETATAVSHIMTAMMAVR